MKYLLFLLLFLSACSYFVKWQKDQPDNAIEEAVEEVIEEVTGVEIDLTPLSPEIDLKPISEEETLIAIK